MCNAELLHLMLLCQKASSTTSGAARAERVAREGGQRDEAAVAHRCCVVQAINRIDVWIKETEGREAEVKNINR